MERLFLWLVGGISRWAARRPPEDVWRLIRLLFEDSAGLIAVSIGSFGVETAFRLLDVTGRLLQALEMLHWVTVGLFLTVWIRGLWKTWHTLVGDVSAFRALINPILSYLSVLVIRKYWTVPRSAAGLFCLLACAWLGLQTYNADPPKPPPVVPGTITVLVPKFPSNSPYSREEVIQAVEDQLRSIHGPDIAFRSSETAFTFDQRVQTAVRDEAGREGDTFVFAAYDASDGIRMELIPLESGNRFVRVPVYFESLSEESANLDPVAYTVALSLRAGRAGIMLTRGSEEAAVVEELEGLLGDADRFPVGLDPADAYAFLAAFFGRADRNSSLSSLSTATALEALDEYKHAADAFKQSHRVSEYRTMLHDHALLLLALNRPVEALEVITPALENFQLRSDPSQWTQIHITRCLIVVNLPLKQERSLAEDCIIDLDLVALQTTMHSDLRASLNNTRGLLFVLNDRGDGHRIALALPLYEEAVILFTDLCKVNAPSCFSLAYSQHNLAHALMLTKSANRRADLERASELLFNALQRRTRDADVKGWCASSLLYARAQAELGALVSRNKMVEDAIRTAESVAGEPSLQSNPSSWASVYEAIAFVHSVWQGPGLEAHLRKAEQLYEIAGRLFEKSGDDTAAGHCHDAIFRLKHTLTNIKKFGERAVLDIYASQLQLGNIPSANTSGHR